MQSLFCLLLLLQPLILLLLVLLLMQPLLLLLLLLLFLPLLLLPLVFAVEESSIIFALCCYLRSLLFPSSSVMLSTDAPHDPDPLRLVSDIFLSMASGVLSEEGPPPPPPPPPPGSPPPSPPSPPALLGRGGTREISSPGTVRGYATVQPKTACRMGGGQRHGLCSGQFKATIKLLVLSSLHFKVSQHAFLLLTDFNE